MTFIDFFKLILFFCVKRPHIVHIGVFLLSEICKYTMAGNEMHKKGKRNLKNKKLKKKSVLVSRRKVCAKVHMFLPVFR